uniref:Metalloendopeptidase n=1 Tax=Strongyloides papillosus TaxID=174720 RepID=A0A0N5BJE5_STREA
MVILSYTFILIFFCAVTNSIKAPNFNDDTNIYRQKRAVLRDLTYKWNESIIYYKVDTNISKDNIAVALEEIMEETCLRFQEVSLSTRNRSITGFYFQLGYMDATNLGRKLDNGNFQNLWLTSKYPERHKVLRVVLYALGVDYEYNRPDSEKYVWTLWTSIQKRYMPYMFKKNNKTVTTYDLPFDFKSVMALNQYEYSNKPGFKPFVMVKEEDRKKNLDTVNENLSTNDIKLLNLHYCGGKCIKMSVCQNGGELDIGGCSKCKCPPKYTGRYCQRLKSVDHKICGPADILIDSKTEEEKELKFSDKCGYSFRAHRGKVVEMKVEFTKKRNISEYLCTENAAVELKFERDKIRSGLVACDIIDTVLTYSEDELFFLNFYGTKNDKVKISYREIIPLNIYGFFNKTG